MENTFNGYSTGVQLKTNQAYLKAFRLYSELFNQKKGENIPDCIEEAFKPLLNRLHHELEEKDRMIEGLKKQIRP